MSRSNTILKLFGHSPLQPLEAHMAKVHQCAKLLVPFVEAALSNDWQAAQACQIQITELEHEADELKKDLRIHMPKSLFLPVPRTDLLELLTIQDRIANKTKDIAGLMLGRKMCPPTEMTEAFRQYIQRSVEASSKANKAINELDDLLEAGFRGREVELVKTMINELDAIEHDTDQLQISLRNTLFKLEKQLSPIDAMFLYRIIEEVGALADRAQQVGSRLQLLMAR